MKRREHRTVARALHAFLCITLVSAATLSQPLLAPSQVETARTLIRTGQWAEAQAVLSSYLEQYPTDAPAHFLLGYVYFHEQKARDSLAAYTAGAAYQRPSAADLRVVASDYVLLEDLVDADRWFTEVVTQTPQDADAWYLLGRTKYGENRFAEAIASFEHVLALHPQDVAAEDNRGLCYEGLGRTQEAKAAFERAIAWQGAAPGDGQPYLNLGDVLTTEGDYRAAIPLLTQAAGLAPDNPRVHERLARAYEGVNDLSNAQRELEIATRLAPTASALHFKLGQIYRRLGRTQQAQTEFAQCARLDGTHSSTEVPNPFRSPAHTNPPPPEP